MLSGIVLSIGLGIVVIGWALHFNNRRKAGLASDWPRAQARITRSEVVHKREHDGEDGEDDVYYAEVEYAYQVDGRGLTGKRVAFGAAKRFSQEAKAQAIVARYPPGRDVEALYNPRKPEEAVLESTRPGLFTPILLTVVGGILTVVGLALL